MTKDIIERVEELIEKEMKKRKTMEESRSKIRILFEKLPDNENIVLKAKSAKRVILLIKRADGKLELIDTTMWLDQDIPAPTFQRDIEEIMKHLGENIVSINEFMSQDSGTLGLSLHWPVFGSVDNFTELLK
ncbi:MAG: hypothetical protein WC788_00595 [Candidatus Paceibacterota bacterium]|jgi:hypothetical protein